MGLFFLKPLNYLHIPKILLRKAINCTAIKKALIASNPGR